MLHLSSCMQASTREDLAHRRLAYRDPWDIASRFEALCSSPCKVVAGIASPRVPPCVSEVQASCDWRLYFRCLCACSDLATCKISLDPSLSRTVRRRHCSQLLCFCDSVQFLKREQSQPSSHFVFCGQAHRLKLTFGALSTVKLIHHLYLAHDSKQQDHCSTQALSLSSSGISCCQRTLSGAQGTFINKQLNQNRR